MSPQAACRGLHALPGVQKEGAEVEWFWYRPGMRRKYQTTTNSPDATTNMAALTKANFNLLTKLIPWLDANERIQRKFRFAVIHKLTRIEAAVSMLLVGQQVQMQRRHEYYADKLEEDARSAEEFISRQSEVAGLRIIQYIHTESQPPDVRHDRRRKWWGWEI